MAGDVRVCVTIEQSSPSYVFFLGLNVNHPSNQPYYTDFSVTITIDHRGTRHAVNAFGRGVPSSGYVNFNVGDEVCIVKTGNVISYTLTGVGVFHSHASNIDQPFYVDTSFLDPWSPNEDFEFTLTTCGGEAPTCEEFGTAGLVVVDRPADTPNNGWGNPVISGSRSFPNNVQFCFTLQSFESPPSAFQMLGLSANPGGSDHHNTIDFAAYIRLKGTTTVQPFSLGVPESSASPIVVGDTVCVQRIGPTVSLTLNGLSIFSYPASSSMPLYADSSFYSAPDSNTDVTFSETRICPMELATPTPTPSFTPTPSRTPSISKTATVTPSATVTPTRTATPSTTPIPCPSAIITEPIPTGSCAWNCSPFNSPVPLTQDLSVCVTINHSNEFYGFIFGLNANSPAASSGWTDMTVAVEIADRSNPASRHILALDPATGSTHPSDALAGSYQWADGDVVCIIKSGSTISYSSTKDGVFYSHSVPMGGVYVDTSFWDYSSPGEDFQMTLVINC